VAQIALAWLLGNTAVTSVIIGARRLAQLEDDDTEAGGNWLRREICGSEDLRI
jgi:aryl-alcohol dehydrogenase-like predicted oxidoreductase